MLGRKHVVSLSVVGLLAMILCSISISQETAETQPERRRDSRERGRRDPEQMRQRMVERMKETLEVKDEEWKVLEPRITKVFSLMLQTRGRFFRGRRFQGQRRPDSEQASRTERQQSKVEKAQNELRTILENKDAKTAEIKQKLKALREAQEKAKQELAKAQEELRGVLTLRQEAQLVLMGILN